VTTSPQYVGQGERSLDLIFKQQYGCQPKPVAAFRPLRLPVRSLALSVKQRDGREAKLLYK
jgi:hypothetical protein